MARNRTGKRCGVLAACVGATLLATACWSGEPSLVSERNGASPVLVVATAGPARESSRSAIGAILTDADLAAIAASNPPAQSAAVARPTPAAPVAGAAAPLPPEIVSALEPRPSNTPSGAHGDLAISFGDSQREVFQTALDAASVLDDPLPPAAPAPDLY